MSQALIEAAAALFSERPSGHVTVREIAGRADVNPALVHRYFGSKQTLMRAAMEKSQHTIAASIEEVDDVRRDIGVVFRAVLEEKEFVAVLARASLDGALPDFPAGYPAMSGLLRRLEAQLEARRSVARHDPRVVVACLGALALGYALFGQFIRRGTHLDEAPDGWVDSAIIDVLQEMAALALGEEQATEDAARQ